MKRIIYTALLVLVLSAVFVVPVFAQTDPPPVETVPLTIEQFPWIGVLLVAGVTFLVTLGIKSISGAFGIDISGKASAITAAVVLGLTETINGLLANVPASAIPAVTAGLGFVFTLLSAFGIAGLLKKFTTKPDAPEVANKPLLVPKG